MPGPGTTIEAPLFVGTRPMSGINTPAINDINPVQCMARGTIVAAGTVAQTASIYLPIGSVILDLTADTTTAWSSGTAVVTAGTAAADNTYAVSTSVASTGRVRPTFSAANLLNLGNVVGTGLVAVTIAPTGATTAGVTVITLEYAPVLQPYVGAT